MGFRNPITTAVDPTARQAAADAQAAANTALTQIIPGTRLAADAIDGKTITGATFRTAGAASQRVQIDSANGLIVYDTNGNVIVSLAPGGKLTTLSGNGGKLLLDGNIGGGGNGGGLVLKGGTGTTDGVVRTDLLTSNGTPIGRRTILDPGAISGYTGNPATVTLQTLTASSSVQFDADTVTIPTSAITADTSAINRIYLTGRFASGIVTITPTAANTPTSVFVSFGKTFTAPPAVICTPNSTAPGTVVTGVGATGVTTTGFTCWVTRTSTTATGVYWVAVDAAF